MSYNAVKARIEDAIEACHFSKKAQLLDNLTCHWNGSNLVSKAIKLRQQYKDFITDGSQTIKRQPSSYIIRNSAMQALWHILTALKMRPIDYSIRIVTLRTLLPQSDHNGLNMDH